MALRIENVRHAGQAQRRADRADEQQRFAPHLVDQRHAHHCGGQVHGADGDRLQVAGNLAVARRRENVVQVIEDGVDAGKLIEHADGDGEKNRQAVFPREERLGFVRSFQVNGLDYLPQFRFGVFGFTDSRHGAGLFDAALRDQPARAARNAKQHHEEKQRGQRRHAELPAPFVGARPNLPTR